MNGWLVDRVVVILGCGITLAVSVWLSGFAGLATGVGTILVKTGEAQISPFQVIYVIPYKPVPRNNAAIASDKVAMGCPIARRTEGV
jgi:hypothetical protein